MSKLSLELQLMDRAIELIRQGWTQGAGARTADGVSVDSRHPDATCFCTIGAFGRAATELRSCFPLSDTLWLGVRSSILAKIALRTGQRFIWQWNDSLGQSQEEILALLTEVREDYAQAT